MAPEPSKRPKAPPKTVADFTILPLTLSALPGIPSQQGPAKHYLYIKPHTPSIPTPSAERSLFVTNVPIDATTASFRVLFADQLGGSMVERVEFDASVPAQPMHKRWKSDKASDDNDKRGKKRKRDEEVVAEGVVEDEESALPSIWPGELRKSGSSAVIIFVDRGSCRGAYREVQRAVKESKEITWKAVDAVVGVERYKSHTTLLHPSHTTLQSSINAYLTQFTALESLRTKHRKHARSVPDADGFVTVTRGGRAGPARLEQAEAKKAELDERKKKNGVKDDFYRFQNREKRKEAEMGLRRRFEEDRERVRKMRESRGKVRPER